MEYSAIYNQHVCVYTHIYMHINLYVDIFVLVKSLGPLRGVSDGMFGDSY